MFFLFEPPVLAFPCILYITLGAFLQFLSRSLLPPLFSISPLFSCWTVSKFSFFALTCSAPISLVRIVPQPLMTCGGSCPAPQQSSSSPPRLLLLFPFFRSATLPSTFGAFYLDYILGGERQILLLPETRILLAATIAKSIVWPPSARAASPSHAFRPPSFIPQHNSPCRRTLQQACRSSSEISGTIISLR
jgi:hypothetical protein